MNPNTSHNSNQTDLKSTSLLGFLYRRRKIILVVSAVAAVVSVIASLMIEEKYKSTVIMFAAETNSLGKTFMSNNYYQDILKYGETEEAEQLLQIINSDEIQESIVAKHNLWDHYELNPGSPGAKSQLTQKYSSNISAELTKYGAIEVEVMDKDPETAMFIARDITSLVDSVSNRLKRERAMHAVALAQNEHENLLSEIAELETRMAALRDKGIYDYYLQIEGLNELYATAVALGFNDEARQLDEQMAEIARYGQEYEHVKSLLTSSYIREETIKKNYDLLLFDIKSQVPVKFVVNEAQVADSKSYPIRWLIVVMSVISAFVFTVILLLVFENYNRLQSEQQA